MRYLHGIGYFERAAGRLILATGLLLGGLGSFPPSAWARPPHAPQAWELSRGGDGDGPRYAGAQHTGSHRPSQRLERLVESLALDAETHARVNAVIDAGRDKKRTLREQLHEARKQMHSLLDTDSPSESAVMRQVEHIGALRTELRKEQLKTMLGVRALLSPEQRAVLRDAFGKHGRRGGHGKDRQRRHEGSHSGRPGR